MSHALVPISEVQNCSLLVTILVLYDLPELRYPPPLLFGKLEPTVCVEGKGGGECESVIVPARARESLFPRRLRVRARTRSVVVSFFLSRSLLRRVRGRNPRSVRLSASAGPCIFIAAFIARSSPLERNAAVRSSIDPATTGWMHYFLLRS